MVWSLGALVDGLGRKKFDEFYRQLITGQDKEHPKPKALKIGKVSIIGLAKMKKNHCDGDIFEHSFRLQILKLCSNISPSQ